MKTLFLSQYLRDFVENEYDEHDIQDCSTTQAQNMELKNNKKKVRMCYFTSNKHWMRHSFHELWKQGWQKKHD